MSFREIARRIRTEVKAGIDNMRKKVKNPKAFYDNIVDRLEGQAALKPIFPFDARGREEYTSAFRQLFPDKTAETVAVALATTGTVVEYGR